MLEARGRRMRAPPMSSAVPARHRSRVLATLRALVRTRVTTGLIVVLPIYVTWLVAKFVFGVMRDASQWVVLALLESAWFQTYVLRVASAPTEKIDIQQFLAAHPYLDWGIAISSVLLTIFLLYVIGLFAANIVGHRLLELLDRIVARVPLVKTVYRSLKQIMSSFAGDQTQSFRRVALVPFPDSSMRAVGFVTNTFRDSVTGEELCSVFIATTPNPTTGYLQVLKRNDITELNWTVEDAIRMVMSGGILAPPFLTLVQNKNLPRHVPAGVGPAPLPAAPTRAAPPGIPPP